MIKLSKSLWSDAQESIVLYLDFLRTKDKKTLQKIIDYNEDDVRATMVVKDYLAGLSGKDLNAKDT